jgi:hypothetical protein
MSDKKHVHMLSELYAHPIAHNIEWRDLIPALTSIGLTHVDKNGDHHFTRNDHTVAFGHANHDTLDAEEILKLRHFIRDSAAAKNKTPDLANDIIVAIDHHRAIVFHDPDTAFESRTEEHADQTKFRVLHKHPKSPPFSNVGPGIDDDYYDSVIKEMANARRIVILGHGTSASNAASQLMAKISEKNPETASRIVAIQRCDLEAMTEPQMISLGKQLLSPEHSG